MKLTPAGTITADEGAKSMMVFKVVLIIVSQALFCLVTCYGCNVSSLTFYKCLVSKMVCDVLS